jgi:hypothetical protein
MVLVGLICTHQILISILTVLRNVSLSFGEVLYIIIQVAQLLFLEFNFLFECVKVYWDDRILMRVESKYFSRFIGVINSKLPLITHQPFIFYATINFLLILIRRSRTQIFL